MRLVFHAAVVLALTLLTQVGGLAWVMTLILARLFRSARARLVAFTVLFVVSYGAVWSAAQALTPF